MNEENTEELLHSEKKKQLYLKQKETLQIFLARGAISEKQYNKSLGDLTVKMGFDENGNELKKE